MSETTQITLPLIAALCDAYPESLWTRRNVGMARAGQRMVRFGAAGQADIQGIHRGRAIEIETKTRRGVLSEFQKNWRTAVMRAGGVYILARSVDEGLDAVRAIV